MTRRFDGHVFCPHCRQSHTKESAFERWMRGRESLDSGHGIVRFDLDVLLHRYMATTDKKGDRNVQCLMGIEVKTHGAQLLPAQRDTFSMLSQVLRNRRTNIHSKKRGRHALDRIAPCKAFSHMLDKYVSLRMYGMHLLELSKNDPIDSDEIRWDRKKIDAGTLVQILRFDRDPDTLEAIDYRRRYSAFDEPKLFVPQEIA